MKPILFGTLLLAVVLASATLAAAAPLAPTAPAVAGTPPAWPYNLYGNATTGWGLTSTTISMPGPTLIVTTGEALDLYLYSQDGATHTWFIDVNNDSSVGVGEPESGSFSATTGAVRYSLNVTVAPGTYTYRCGVHPGTMWGELLVMPTPTFTLWGSTGPFHGWGFTSTSITYPGPTLNVTQGQTVTIDLFSADGVDHTFYVDFAKTGSIAGNTVSADFNGTHPVRFTFVASQAGNFTYTCGIHGPIAMKGTLSVASSGTPSSPPDYTLYASAIVMIVIVAIIAAVVIQRKPKSPPAQPPVNPPSPPQG